MMQYLRHRDDLTQNRIGDTNSGAIRADHLTYLIWSCLALGSLFSLSLAGKQYKVYLAELALFFVFFVLLVVKRIKLPLNIVFTGQYLFLLSAILSVSAADDKLQSFTQCLPLVYGLLAVVVAYNCYGPFLDPYFQGIRLFALILSIQIIVVVWLNNVNVPITYYAYKHQVETLLGRSNYLAIYLEFAILSEIILRRRKWLFYSLVFGFSFILTLSRAGTIVLVIGFLLIMGVDLLRGKRKRIAWIFVLVLLTAIALPLAERTKIFANSLTEIQYASSVQSRLHLWDNAVDDFFGNPLLGIGLKWTDDVHNVVIKVLSNTGILGAVLFGLIILSVEMKLMKRLIVIIRSKDNSDDSNIIIALFIGFTTQLVHSMFEPFYFNTPSQIWLGLYLAAYMVALRYKAIPPVLQ